MQPYSFFFIEEKEQTFSWEEKEGKWHAPFGRQMKEKSTELSKLFQKWQVLEGCSARIARPPPACHICLEGPGYQPG